MSHAISHNSIRHSAGNAFFIFKTILAIVYRLYFALCLESIKHRECKGDKNMNKLKSSMRGVACLLICCIIAVGIPFTVTANMPDPGLPVVKGEWEMRLGDLLNASPERKVLTVGGDTFGVRLFAGGITVISLSGNSCPAAKAGICKGDVILKIDAKDMHTTSDVVEAIEHSSGKSLTVSLRRGEAEVTVTLTPTLDPTGSYRAGIRVRDNAAGIGTMTYIDPRTGAFGGLGHGICDSESGALLPLERGAVLAAEISDVVRGAEGVPGELKGYLGSKKIGTLLQNCDCGVFGVLSPIPTGETMEVASRDHVRAGEAYLRCTLGDEQPHDYKIELTNIDKSNTGTKCFAVHVTDPALLARTGGIVQGMSGSPIIQNGKLIGAVTHVLIGDPTRGYGIFIKNMLDSMPSEIK